MLHRTTNSILSAVMKCAYIGVSIALVLLTVPAAIIAQTAVRAPATLSGVVTDSEQAAIARARVAVTNLESGSQLVTSTNETGAYTFNSLPAGRYRIEASMHRFVTTSSEVTLDAGITARGDCKMFRLYPYQGPAGLDISHISAIDSTKMSVWGDDPKTDSATFAIDDKTVYCKGDGIGKSVRVSGPEYLKPKMEKSELITLKLSGSGESRKVRVVWDFVPQGSPLVVTLSRVGLPPETHKEVEYHFRIRASNRCQDPSCHATFTGKVSLADRHYT